MQPTDKEEIANIISSFNAYAVSGPNSIPNKNEISKQLTNLFKLPFMTGVFAFGTQNCKSSSCVKERFKIRL